MTRATTLQQVIWLIGLIVLLTGLSELAGGNWYAPHWSSAERAWVTPSGDSTWDSSTAQWQSDSGDRWDDARQTWVSPSGAWWDASANVWRDSAGNTWDSQNQTWIDPSGAFYWSAPAQTWVPISAQ